MIATIRRNIPPRACSATRRARASSCWSKALNKAPRSALYIPASNPRALEKARGLDTDGIILDLEDAVAPDAKAQARDAAAAALKDLSGKFIVLRINALSTSWGREDLAMALAAKPAALLLPKIADAEDVIEARAGARGLPLWAMIETPRAV